MIASANRLRSVGWLVLLGLCLALVLVLAFKVNALRSQIHHAEQRIVALKQERLYLETEFETRSNQQQLKVWNDVEFGYAAPGASQYLEGERQLAELSMPATPDAPAPIRVASVDDSVIASAAFPAMVSPLSGKALASNDRASQNEDADRPSLSDADRSDAVETLKDRLGKVVDARPKGPVRQETASEKERPKKDAAKSAAKASVSEKPDAKSAADRKPKLAAKATSTAPKAKADSAKARPVQKAKAETAPAPKAKATSVADKSPAKKDKSALGSRPAARKEAKAAR